ncbi:hypothetical protein JCM3766R1_001696 [Sporobolomyces carnicolor]
MRSTFVLRLLSFATGASAAVFNCVGGSVYVVAHPDDDLLFQAPDLQTDVSSKSCITTVFLTSGDSGTTTTYAQSREAGSAAAYSQMAQVPNSWTSVTAILGGQPVLVQTLVASPQIQRVIFRLPDGNMDGTGYGLTGYESLRSLYFGSISTISSFGGSATFTLSTLKQAINEVIAARQPTRVRTLDYLSQFDCGDHSDHLATAKIVASLVPTNVSLSGYIAYGVANFPPTMTTSDASFMAKSSAFFAYTPYDVAECQSYTACVQAGRGEAYWLRRQYVTSPSLAFSSFTGSAQVPVTLPNGTNVARLGTAYASSQDPASPASAAIDGIVGGYPGNDSVEWSAAGETNTAWWGVAWDKPYNISSIVLYDRPNRDDWITGCTLTFSDKSTVSVGALANDGSATLVTLPGTVVTQMVVVAVTSTASSTENAGLAEFQAYGAACPACRIGNTFGNYTANTTTSGGVVSGTGAYSDLALFATASASSWPATQPPQRAIDGVLSGYPLNASAEWSSVGQTVGAWLNLTWPAYYLVDSIALYDRPNPNDWITSGVVEFDDGTTVAITKLNNDGTATWFNLSTPVNMSSLVFTVKSTGPSSANIGLSEIVVSYSQPQTPVPRLDWVDPLPTAGGSKPAFDTSRDLARNATALSSTSSLNQGPNKAIDGNLGGYTPQGGVATEEWATAGEKEGAWIKLSWPFTITVNQVVLYDRPNLDDQITGATLRFEDGSLISTGALANDGSATNVSVPALNTTSIFLTVDSVSKTTSNVGLREFAVYGSIPTVSNSSTSSTNSTSQNVTVVGSASLPVPTGLVNLALGATATASTANPSQGASKAIDGLTKGYKEDGTGSPAAEWATNREGLGATITLRWPSPVIVSAVVLYDRPNSVDEITSGTLTLSDGSRVGFGALPNNGAAYVVPFKNVTTSSITLLVTGISATTNNVGLAEFEVYGSLAPYNSTVYAGGSALLTLPSTPDLALNATAVASSASPNQGAAKAINGVINGYKDDGTGDYTQEWATASQKVGAWITLTWPGPIKVSTIALYDRPNSNDQVTGATLKFDDGSVMTIGALPNGGAAFVVPVNNVVTRSITLNVTSVSPTTGSAGLTEFAVYGSTMYNVSTSPNYPGGSASLPVPQTTDLALVANASASSASTNQGALKAIDGYVNGYKENGSGDYTKEWATPGEGAGATLTLTWPTAINVSTVVLYDRPNLNDQITSGLLAFSDGTIYSFGTLPNNGSALVVPVNNVVTSWIQLRVSTVSSTTGSAGLAEIAVYGSLASGAANTTAFSSGGSTLLPVPSTPDLALNATATASSAASSNQGAAKAVNGVINGYKDDGSGDPNQEWATANQGAGAWITLTWPGSVNVSTVVLYDRPNSGDQITGGTLRFDDGSTYAVGPLPNSGIAFVVPVRNVVTRTVTFSITNVSSTTSNVGLQEFAVYGTPLYSVVTTSSAAGSNLLLPVPQTPDLALVATATASSSGTNQGASKAIDGYINGYKENGSGDYTKEWATASQGVGANITLTWPTLINVSTVVLYDRPNLNDQITSALVSFSQGSVVYQVGPLPNNGSALVVPVNNVVTQSITLKVTGVSATTGSAGLAEFAVYGALASNANATALSGGSTLVPVPSTPDLALNSTASASSSASSSQGASKAIDGYINGYKEDGTGDSTREWATSNQGVGAWITLTWPGLVNVSSVALYDRPNANDQITGGTLRFDDGSTLPVNALPNNGQGLVVPVANVVTKTITFTVTGVSSTTASCGLAEFAVYGTPLFSLASSSTPTPGGSPSLAVPQTPNLARDAVAQASSSSTGQAAAKANDGAINGYKENGTGDYTKEWATASQGAGANITLLWPSSVNVSTVVLYDRPNLNDQITSGLLVFSDGTIYSVGTLPNNGSALVVPVNNLVTRSVTLKVTGVSSTTGSVGLAEFQVYGSYSNTTTTTTSTPLGSSLLAVPTSPDLALNATVSASSSSSGQPATSAIDGVVNGYKENGMGDYTREWASKNEGVGATLSISFPTFVSVSTLVLYDRPNLQDQITSGRVLFSDGSIFEIATLPNNGSALVVPIVPTVKTNSILFTVTGVSATTTSVGLAEFAVYGNVPFNSSASSSSSNNNTLAAAAGATNVTISSSNSTTTTNETLTAAKDNNSTMIDSSGGMNSTTALGAQNSTVLPTTITNSTLVGNSTTTIISGVGVNSTSSDLGGGNSTIVGIMTNSTSSLSNTTSTTSTSSGNLTLPATTGNNTTVGVGGSNSSDVARNNTLGSSSSSNNGSTTTTTILTNGTSSSYEGGAIGTNSTFSTTTTSLGGTTPTTTTTSSSSTTGRSSGNNNTSSSFGSSSGSGFASSSSSGSSSSVSSSSTSAASSSASVSSSSGSNSTTSTASTTSSSSTASSSASVSSSTPSSESISSATSTSSSSPSSSSSSSTSSSSSSASQVPSSTTSSDPVSSSAATSADSKGGGLALAKPTDPDVNLGPLANKVSASSSLSDQPPKMVIDGTTGPEDPKNGWIAKGTSSSEWIQLDWTENQYLIKSIALFGLSSTATGNTTSTITRGLLSFSDGTIVKVEGPISPKGSWVSLGPEGIYSSSVRFTAVPVASDPTIENLIGLSEIQIFNGPVPSDANVVGKLGNVSQGTTLTEALKSMGLRFRRRTRR